MPPRQRVQAMLRLDANESPFNAPDNRYPDEDLCNSLRRHWGCHERIPESCIYFTNGTEEAIDLCMRLYAFPGRDSLVCLTPTRDLYRRRATLNHIECREVALRENYFSLDVEAVLDAVDDTTQMIFLCSPNSPTGNLLSRSDIEMILELFEGMVVVDESYIDYVPHASVLSLLNKYKNLVILRSFSHAWSAAALRLAAVVARPEVIAQFKQMGWVHPISSLVAHAAWQVVNRRLDIDKWVRQIVSERIKVEIALKELGECIEVYPSDTNFLLVRFSEPQAIYHYLLEQGIAVYPVCGCLRITIGLPGENSALLGALRRRQM